MPLYGDADEAEASSGMQSDDDQSEDSPEDSD